MPDEALLNCFNIKSQVSILSFRDIEILPFEGQGISVQQKKPGSAPQAKLNSGLPKGGGGNMPRKTVSHPSGKLVTANLGIKETLNPTRKKSVSAQETSILPDIAEPFTFEELEYVWKEYSLSVKRERKDNLYSTLVTSQKTMTSDYKISLELVNLVQANDLDREKAAILDFLRKKLNNYSITLNYTITEVKKAQVLDNKGVFDKLAEDNTSLNKFRKLFNLDIEF